jgi:mRNA guanylyltransferase
MISRMQMDEHARLLREQDAARLAANASMHAAPRAMVQQYEFESPKGLIFNHLQRHREAILRRKAELESEGKRVNVEIECRLGTLMYGSERVGAFEAGKEGTIVPDVRSDGKSVRFCPGVAGVHHRQFIEAAKRDYTKESLRLSSQGKPKLRAAKATLSDVWTPDDGPGRSRSGRRFLRDAHPLLKEEVAAGMRSICERTVKQEIKHKDICPDLNIHLPSHKYDLRVSVSIEEVVLGAAQIDFSDVMFDRKRDRFSQVCVLPPQHANIPMPDMDASEVLSRKPNGALETTFEFELEANKDITAEFLGSTGMQVVQSSLRLSQSLWYGICSFIPQECNSSSLIRYASFNLDARCDADIQGVKQWVLLQCGSRGDRFPGAMPVSLDRWKFKETLLKYSKSKSYVVGEKTDGVRHFLVVGSEKSFLVDREFSLFVCEGIDDLSRGNSQRNGPGLPVGTILDGEIVRHRGLEPPRDVFLAFDIISRGDKAVHQLPFKDRRQHLEEVVQQFLVAHPDCLRLPLPLLRKKFWPMDKIDELNKCIGHDGIDCVYQHRCPSTGVEYNHKCDGFIFVHNDPYIFNTDTYMMKWKPVEDLSIDFLVVFEQATRPKFYYVDEGEQLVDVTVLLHFDRGSQLSDHDIGRLLADLNRYGQDQQTEDGLPYLIAEFAFDSETSAWHYMRPRTDKKKPNFRDTVLPGLLDIGLNISKEELMYRLLCAEREDKKGDRWSKEMQEMRKNAFDRKRNEPHQDKPDGPQRKQPHPAAEGGGGAAGGRK